MIYLPDNKSILIFNGNKSGKLGSNNNSALNMPVRNFLTITMFISVFCNDIMSKLIMDGVCCSIAMVFDISPPML